MFDAFPHSISTYGADIDGLIKLIWWIVFPFLIAAEGALVYFLIRYRRRKGHRAAWMPADTWKTNAWVLGPAVIVLICDMFIEVSSHGVWDRVVATVPSHDVLVRVKGRQFSWTFTYAGKDGMLDTPDDFQTANVMHVPRDQIVRLQIESEDVLHSFWVPVLRLKQDAVPGRSIPSWFEATEDGEFDIACAELCGPAHTAMRARLVVESPEVFASWEAVHAEQDRLRETR